MKRCVLLLQQCLKSINMSALIPTPIIRKLQRPPLAPWDSLEMLRGDMIVVIMEDNLVVLAVSQEEVLGDSVELIPSAWLKQDILRLTSFVRTAVAKRDLQYIPWSRLACLDKSDIRGDCSVFGVRDGSHPLAACQLYARNASPSVFVGISQTYNCRHVLPS